MRLIETPLNDLFEIEPQVFEDKRGYFLESYNSQKFRNLSHSTHFIQDNESKSTKGVLRGLHFQAGEYSQAKLVRCILGEVLDVVVDLRKDSSTFAKYYSVILSDSNKKQLFVPKGFAHGFLVLSDVAIFSYKVDALYNPKSERGIIWDDPDLNIDWKMNTSNLILSEKDKKLPKFKDLDTFF